MRITKLAVVLMCGALGVAGHYAGLPLPWEAVLQSILMTAQGPATRIAAWVVIVVTGALLMSDPGMSAMRKLAQFAYAIAVVCAQRLVRDVLAVERAPDQPKTQPDIDKELNDMNADYEIYSKNRPNWKPVSVKDDGEAVYIQFPASSLRYRMPVLFIPDASGRALATQYELRGNIGIVNRLFNSAELKTVGHRACSVRIRLRKPRCPPATDLPDLAA